MIEEVAAYLDTASTRFTAGTNLYVNYMPDEPHTATTLYENAGIAPTRVYGNTVWENPRVQVLSRSTSSTRARTDIGVVFTVLEQVCNAVISGSTYLRIAAVQSPFLIDRDQLGRTVFGVNFDVLRRL